MNEVRALLLSTLDEAYDKGGWHGPTLRVTLRGVSGEALLWRPAPGRHNIWELALHTAYWTYVARRRMTGERRGTFPWKGTNWFASPRAFDEEQWHEVILLLDGEHRAFRATVEQMSDADLRNPKKLRLVRGLAAHDLYHAGQIGLLKRLASG